MSLLLIGSALAGAGMGLAQNAKRKSEAERNLLMSEALYDQTLAARQGQRSILEGQLTVGAMQNTANSREAAIAKAQGEASQRVALGQSGMSGGTPFYKLDQDIRDNTVKMSEMLYGQNVNFQGMVEQAKLQEGQGNMQLQQAIWGLQAADKELDYLSSPAAMILSAGTGALSGMSMMNSLNTAVVNMTGGTLEEGISGLFGGKARSSQPSVPANRYTNPSQPFNAQPMASSFSEFQPFNQDPLSSMGWSPGTDMLNPAGGLGLPSSAGINLAAFDFFGMNAVKSAGKSLQF